MSGHEGSISEAFNINFKNELIYGTPYDSREGFTTVTGVLSQNQSNLAWHTLGLADELLMGEITVAVIISCELRPGSASKNKVDVFFFIYIFLKRIVT